MSRRHSVVDQEPWETFQTSSSTKTTTMTTAAKLYGKDLSEYDDVDVDDLLAQLTPEEINILAKEVDPDVRELELSLPCLIYNSWYKYISYNLYSYRIALCHHHNVAAMNVTRVLQDR